MKLILKPLVQLIPALMFCATAQATTINHNNVEMVPTGKGYGVARPSADPAVTEAAPTGYVPAGYGIYYHGGPIITGTAHIYYIWYGNWAGLNPAAQPILTDFAKTIGGSPRYNINTTYSNAANVKISNSVTLAGQATDNYSQGTSLSDAAVYGVVRAAITSGRLPKDTNGIYFVLTSKDVTETSGFGSMYCGWHTANTMGVGVIKYSFVGDPTTIAPKGCGAQSVTPNGNFGADSMASTIAHELEETVTDPNYHAWYDNSGYENSDKCAWTFGTPAILPSGAYYNMTLGARKYLIQQNWANVAPSGRCAMSY